MAGVNDHGERDDVPGRCHRCGAQQMLAPPARGAVVDPGGRGGLPGLDPVELLDAAACLVATAKRVSSLVSDAEWFAAPWRVEGGDEYTDLRAHVDAAGLEARAAARVVYLIGQNAVTHRPPTQQ